MKTVKIISGTYGYRPLGKKQVVPVSIGGTALVDDIEAERLVKLKVAVVVDENTTETTENTVATPDNDIKNVEKGIELHEEETVSNDVSNEDNERIAHLDKSQLNAMTIPNLKKLAEDMGIDTAKFKKKDDFVKALVKVEVILGDEDTEQPPDVGAEAPVV